MKFRALLATVAILLSFAPRPSSAQLSVLETEDLRLIYLDPLHAFLSGHIARCFENSMRMQRELLGYEPSQKVTVIVGDFSDVGNAGAGAVPRNGMALMIAPPSLAYETYPANERINTLMNHELVHVACFDNASGSDRFFRALLRGKVSPIAEHPETIVYNYLTAPRASAPRWFHEGIAVFVETWMAGGVGRAQGAYDEMVFRAMVRDGVEFYDPLGLVSEGTSTDFQLEMNSYLYGARFMSYLAYTRSPEDVIAWVRHGRGSRGHYGAQFRRVFGRSIDEVWQEWVEFEHTFQQENLARIRMHPLTPYEDLVDRGLGSVSRAHLDSTENRLYVAVNYPGTLSYIGAVDLASRRIERLVDVKGPTLYTVTSLAFDPRERMLYYTTDNGGIRDLVALDPRTREVTELVEDARMGDLVVDPRDGAIWGIRHYNGFATIARVPRPFDQWDQIATFPYGEFAFDLDLSPDGAKIAATVMLPTGRAEVRVWETERLADTLDTPLARFDFGASIPLNFTFTPDGEHLMGSTTLTGVSNLFRYSLARGQWDALTNTETGLFRPIALDEESVIAFRFAGAGFVPARLRVQPLEDLEAIRLFGADVVTRRPELQQWNAGSPARVDLDSVVTHRGSYHGWRSLELESLYPIVEGYKDQTAVGLRANLGDPLGLHRLNLAASYTPNESLPEDERLHVQAGYRRFGWTLGFRHNDASFYDLFGPTKSSRKGTAVDLRYHRTLLDDAPKSLELDFDVVRWTGLEVLPDYQNVAASFDETVSSSIGLNWKNRRFSIGAVDYEKGTQASLRLSGVYVDDRVFPDVVGTFDAGVPTGLGNSSVWLRTAAGLARPERDEPFSNFFLGGFGNNWVDRGDEKRYRAWYAFPGFGLNELGGTNFVRAMVDVNLPPLRFRRLGRPGLHAQWIRTSLFGAVLATNVDEANLRTEAASAGLQMDMRIHLLSHLKFTLSSGYAFGFLEGRRNTNEFMLSLKIL